MWHGQETGHNLGIDDFRIFLSNALESHKFSPIQTFNFIFDFLETLGVREKIADWIEEAAGRKDYATVDEHRQFYDKLLNIFDELVEVRIRFLFKGKGNIAAEA